MVPPNFVSLIGRLRSDPALHVLPCGSKVCRAQISVLGAGRPSDADGYLTIKQYGPGAEATAAMLTAGCLVGFCGRAAHGRRMTSTGETYRVVDFVGVITFLSAPEKAYDPTIEDLSAANGTNEEERDLATTTSGSHDAPEDFPS
jgi:hypothetical protein